MVTGGTITGNYNGIYNEQAGTVKVTGGTIIGTPLTSSGPGDSGIYNSDVGSLTIGTKDTNVNTEQPKINGTKYGVYNNGGTFNFYDGRIEGKELQSIYGNVSDVEEEYDVSKYKKGEKEGLEVEEGREVAILDQKEVVQVASTGAKYNSIQKALKNVQDTDTITMLDNVTIIESAETVKIEKGKDITLDLAGYTVTAGKTIENSGTLKVIDSSKTEEQEATGKLVNNRTTLIENMENSTFKFEQGTLEVNANGTESQYIDIIKNKGQTIVTGGTITSGSYYINAINNLEQGTVTMNNGTVILSNKYYGTTGINNNGTVIIKQSVITPNNPQYTSNGYSRAINNSETGNIKMENVQIKEIYTSYVAEVLNSGTGNIEIGGETTSIKRVQNSSTGTITINDGTFKVIDNDKGTVTINGGTFSEPRTTILDNDSGSMIINGGTFSTSGNAGHVISNGSGNITINKGKLICTEDNSNWDTIYNGSGTITIGKKDGNTDEEIEITNMSQTSINNTNGTVNYYGGVIKGKIAFIGKINDIEENAHIEVNVEDGLEVMRLIDNGNAAAEVVGGNTYASLNAAIESCQAGENKQINLLKNIAIAETNKIIVGENKDITINLNGYTITTYTSNYAITNNGKLKITDNNEEAKGKIVSKAYGIINNTNNLTIENGTIRQEKDASNYIIQNAGYLLFSGGTIYSDKRNVGGILSMNAGTVTVTGGNITLQGDEGKAIYVNYKDSSTINITGGKIVGGRFGCGIEVYSSTITISDNADVDYVSGSDKSKITILGGNVGKIGGDANVIMSGGTVGSISYVTNFTMSGGTITNDTTYAMLISGGTATITGGTIETPSSYYGISNQGGGILTITGGTIKTGIDNSSILTLGIDDTNVSKTVPSIIGKEYGVKNTGTFNFYDGVIEGETEAISGTVTKTPTDYTVIYENSNKKATLGIDAVIDNVIKVNGVYYKTLQAAVTAINGMASKTGTIVINGGIALESQVVIPEGTNITIELRGQTISYDKAEPAIVNNGTLTIVDYMDTSEADPSDVSMIKNITGKAIKNNGALTLGINDGTQNANSPVISGGIEGNEPTIYDGKVE